MTPIDDNTLIQDAYRHLLDTYLATNHRKKVEIIDRAFKFARAAHEGVRRRSGEPYILHPIAVAQIACQEIGLGSTSICAALLHDVVEDTEYTVEDIRRHFGDKIAIIVQGLTKISGGIFGDKASLQAENFRKLLLTMSQDIRVVLIKMADRLHNMRTLGSMAPNKQYKIAGETLYIYAPLAHRLGLYAIKTELEDLAFKYEHPAAYEQITAQIAASQQSRDVIYENFARPLRHKLDQMGLDYQARARVKSVYSIWRKMQTKHVPFDQVYDLYAVRIIFKCDDPAKEKSTCWSIYSAITDLYKPHPDRTRDWLTTPKANGYRALHLTVMGPDGKWIEVQIRSERMDAIAEKGFAAHWRYKVGEGDEETELNVWLKTIKDILDNPEPSAIDFLDTLKLNLFASEIVVFTPKGELITLPADATLLDFAFNVHTDLGLHCIAGKVNHTLVPLNHTLQSGDQVEILTSQSAQPQAEWLTFLKTAKARSRLSRTLRRARTAKIGNGREVLDKFLSDNNAQLTVQVLNNLQNRLGVQTRDDLCLLVADNPEVLTPELLLPPAKGKKQGRLSKIIGATVAIIPGMGKKHPHEDEAATGDAGEVNEGGDNAKPVVLPDTHKTYVLRNDDGKPNYIIADCCCPIPGDDVMGFIDDDGRVVVHSLTCPRALVLKAGYGNRILETRWASTPDALFLAHIQLDGIDRHGILQEITLTIATQPSIDLRQLNIQADNEIFHSEIYVKLQNIQTLDDLLNRLKEIPGVQKATRV